MPNSPEYATAHRIDAGFPMPMIYSGYLSDALATDQPDTLLTALHEIRSAMQEKPGTKVCDFDLNLNDVFKILEKANLSPPLNS
jgi:hypothetical protein